jgi:hypothetical protein
LVPTEPGIVTTHADVSSSNNALVTDIPFTYSSLAQNEEYMVVVPASI